jgi:deoxyhypusine synthase
MAYKNEKKKIDLIKLDKLLREGKSQKDCAVYFGVTAAAISKAKKSLKRTFVRTAALERTGQVVEAHLDVLGQLRKANQIVNEQITSILGMLEDRKQVDDFVKLQGTLSTHLKEARLQNEQQLRLFEIYRDFKHYQQFQDFVLSRMEKFDPEVRIKFMKELKKSGLLSGIIEAN